jgi:hypothetical protein
MSYLIADFNLITGAILWLGLAVGTVQYVVLSVLEDRK